jgi:ribulose-5-phosphate 4-epimerase/fuculose-1-phosphate aldolase|tara:strand:+ start:1564 stop:2292 length:729 start_codon:yes stop_codon:yes gene_type:complete
MDKLEILNDLAAVFRWTARLNMHEAVANHFSVSAPDSSEDFYVNGSGMHFSTIKSSDLVLIEQSKINELKDKPELVDPTALYIHGSIHKKVPNAKCILHVHSKYATALATLEDPTLPPIDQNSMRFFNRVGVYSDFGGMGFEEEAIKMANKIGNKKVLLMSNHGILTTGQTVAEAFDELFYFEKACETYITALSTNKKLKIVSDEIAEKTAQEWEDSSPAHQNLHLKAIRSILDSEDPSYKN